MPIKKNNPGNPCSCSDCNCRVCAADPLPAPSQWLLTVSGVTGAYNGEWVLSKVSNPVNAIQEVCWRYVFTGGDTNPDSYSEIQLTIFNDTGTNRWDTAGVFYVPSTPFIRGFPWDGTVYTALATKAGITASGSAVCKCKQELDGFTWDNSSLPAGWSLGRFASASATLTAL